MNTLLKLTLTFLIAVAFAACGSTPELKAPEVPAAPEVPEAPAAPSAEDMVNKAASEAGDDEKKDDEKKDDEKKDDAKKDDAKKPAKSLKKFEGNRMEAMDDDE